ncbi:hypothetical protein BDDG_04199 [Blastomyces dermatitidis ATCC 18188]|uniref:Uncharacterized protein n=2 Tax=Ajellomyces dermatitidis TaxID=5039 RepID=F2TDE5_AJEDA|nr:hypothetical protein BDDG_04199 [Blastomyces dermatitidis ATCC 18188]EQL36918.1 hypothetical protein BDFG_01551 [Blastomyces dermatitidis ATCC 26199]
MRQQICYDDLLSQRDYLAPADTPEDTPLFDLYRLYGHLDLNRTIDIRNELGRLWFNRWSVSSIADPKDHSERERYAVLAAIPALMVTSFNKRVEIGIPRSADAIILPEEMEMYLNAPKIYGTVPECPKKVEPLEEVLKIPHEDGEVLESFEDLRAGRELQEKSILCWQPHIHFI